MNKQEFLKLKAELEAERDKLLNENGRLAQENATLITHLEHRKRGMKNE